MKTIGEYLREGRVQKGLNFKELSDITKIRKNFLNALEKEEWQNLPEYSTVVGYVKSVARALEMDSSFIVSVLRRDYPKELSRSSKQMPLAGEEINKEFRITPQLAFFVGVGTIFLSIVFYLILQYVAFVRPPKLLIDTPIEGQVIIEKELKVSGKTDPNTTVIVNNQPALVSEDGSFSTVIKITEEINTIKVVAISRSGQKTTLSRTIRPEFVN